MPKPLGGVQGSGMHTHISLWEGERNAFVDDERPLRAVRGGAPFIAGLLHHAREITAVTNQWVNSYKRLMAGVRGARARQLGAQQPLRARTRAGGQDGQGRVDADRVPRTGQRLQSLSGLRRDPGRRAAGHRARATRSHPKRTTTSFTLTAEELAKKGIEPLPSSLHDAVNVMECSELLADTLGDHVFEWFIRNKRAEWDEYQVQVTQFELDRYLPLL